MHCEHFLIQQCYFLQKRCDSGVLLVHPMEEGTVDVVCGDPCLEELLRELLCVLLHGQVQPKALWEGRT